MIIYLLLNIVWVYILYRFSTFFFDHNYQSKKLLLFSYILFYVLNSSIHWLFHEPLLNMLTSFAGLFVILLNYKGSMLKRLLAIALIYIMSMLCDIITTVTFSKYYLGEDPKVANTAIAYLLLFILEIAIEHIFTLKKVQKIKYSHWLALMGVPVSSIIIICILEVNGYTANQINIIIILLLLGINILIFSLYNALQNFYLKELEHKYIEKQLDAYAAQMDVMVKSQDKINAIQHDLKHHLNTIRALVDAKQYQDINIYLHSMEDYMTECSGYHYSAHHVIDSILNYMLNHIRTEFQTLAIDIQVPEALNINHFDISIVLGNLLSNAIAASLASESKALKLYMKLDKGVLFMTLENSFENKLLYQNNRYLSTKKTTKNEKHGLGLENVKTIVEKYNGKLEIHHNAHLFQVHIVMYEN